ncbi:glycosyl hydrolase [Streptomyces sp. 71268]|uniref:glycosyl hydrolase n=1 Tax=Streptomyces sp. 71268 TaxID=3002640 RepID=UPI0023F9516A|nr:glycosyl hydrolase [Streptomyces sp. 71268]WEV29132.1 glycosyl hydrolase [Streptomyces sp. 71268]
MSHALDLRLDDLVVADAASRQAEQAFWPQDLTVLAEHHSGPDRAHSYVVAYDRSITWGLPGQPQIAAIKVARDLAQATYTLEMAYHATVPFAQNWLIERGCRAEPISALDGDLMQPADDRTVRVEQQIRDSGTRYEVLGSWTSDFAPCETWTLTRDSDSEQAPIRLFLQEGDFDTHSYTVHEGAFPDEERARRWLDERSGPLPQPPEYCGEAAGHRARAALRRSPGVAALPKAGPDAHQAPSPGTAQRPGSGRSL